jgi:uncharacterized membrane protein (DUF485 family)
MQWQKDNQKSQRTDRQYNGIVCLSFSLSSGYRFAIVLSVCPLWLLVIFLPLYCLSFLLCDFWLSFCHCNVCLSFSVTSGYLFAIVLSVCPLWLLVIFLPLYCLSVLCDFWLSFCHCIVCLSSVTSGYLFSIVLFVCPLFLLVIFLWQWQKDNQKSQRRTDTQYNGKKITRSHRAQTDNTMAKR